MSNGIEVSYHDDGAILFDIRRGRLFAANREGALVWRRLAAGAPHDVIARELTNNGVADFRTALIYVLAFCRQLQTERLFPGDEGD